VRMAIADADAQRIDSRENVELGDGQRGHAIEADGVAQRDLVEPAAAAWPPGGGPHLAPALAKPLAELVLELRREWPRADARRVGLCDPPDLVDVPGPDAGTDAGRARDGVRRGDEGIGPVVEVKHRPLGP